MNASIVDYVSIANSTSIGGILSYAQHCELVSNVSSVRSIVKIIALVSIVTNVSKVIIHLVL